MQPLSRAIECPTNQFAIQTADLLLQKLLAAPHMQLGPRPAVIFDIDGTAIYNTTSAPSRPNRTLRRLYMKLLERNVAIVFLTARPDNPHNREFTERELVANGFPRYEELIMRPREDIERNGLSNYSLYKGQMRRQVARSYRLLMSMGDTRLDMTEWTREGLVRNAHSHGVVAALLSERAYILILAQSTPVLHVKLTG